MWASHWTRAHSSIRVSDSKAALRSLGEKRLMHRDKKGSIEMTQLSLHCLSTSFATCIAHSALKVLFQYNHICPRRHVLLPSGFSIRGHRFKPPPNHTTCLWFVLNWKSKQTLHSMHLRSWRTGRVLSNGDGWGRDGRDKGQKNTSFYLLTAKISICMLMEQEERSWGESERQEI